MLSRCLKKKKNVTSIFPSMPKMNNRNVLHEWKSWTFYCATPISGARPAKQHSGLTFPFYQWSLRLIRKFYLKKKWQIVITYTISICFLSTSSLNANLYVAEKNNQAALVPWKYPQRLSSEATFDFYTKFNPKASCD